MLAETLNDHRQTTLLASLRQSQAFATLSSEDIEAIAAGCHVRSLQKGETLFREGDPAEGFYVVQQGQIAISVLNPDGRERTICVFRPPESFAEIALATAQNYPANATALEPSRVILVRKAHFRELIVRKPDLALRMLAAMSMHLKTLVTLLRDSRGRQIEARLADWLLQQSPAAAAGCPAVFTLPIAKKVLAGQLGVAGETLSRTFARFRDENILRVAGSKITVMDSQKLRAYAEGNA
ncbi:Crp/Fnr family transcriptional regulator [Opitutaceae bacterium EW11]|nr:Crp/Fnr family transcriptional regulator [Opitutaceae bacterium EW11]